MTKPKSSHPWVAPLVEAASGPMIAILFWFVVVLIALMTLAHRKFFEANFFEAFGAIGQVMFAAAVFWLGKQQFDFTKRVTERQARIDTYAIKKELLERFLTLFDIAKGASDEVQDEDFFAAWYELADEVSRVYDQPIDLSIIFLAARFEELRSDTQFMHDLNAKFAGDLPGLQAELQKNWKAIDEHHYKAWWMMHQELLLNEQQVRPLKRAG
jgi:hypothetical protein